MERTNLTNLPPLPALADDWVVRRATPADRDGLARVLALAFPEMGWTAGRVDEALLYASDVDETWLIEATGTVVATTSVQNRNRRQTERATIHWVAADPSLTGKGLGNAINVAVLHAMAALGYTSVDLTTDDHRLAAIKTYLKLGFQPVLTDPTHQNRWQTVGSQLGVDLP